MVKVMNIENLIVGPLETNTYILSKDNEILLIDPGAEAKKIIDCINNRKIVGIIITHYHFDHIGALKEIKEQYNTKVYDINNLSEGKNNIGGFEFECIRTPGHKNDLISIYFEKEKALFCGDFIFEGTIGRWDFEGGSIEDMLKSIQKILKYPKDMTIYPGHGNKTSLQAEKENLEKYLKYF